MNDEDRRQWVSSDEGLYLWFRASRKTLTQFVRENRETLTREIKLALNNKQPVHRLAYGPYDRSDIRW